jgi:hypothetical protein
MTILYAARWDKGGNRQVIRTGCRPFDTQISALGQGNVLGSTITGLYIRPYEEVACNGYSFPPGHLQAFDLKVFQPLPPQVDRAVRARTRTRSGILYKLFHTGTHQVVHGYVWSDYDYNMMNMWVTGRHSRSRDVLTACLPYLVNIETLDHGLLARAMTHHAEPALPPPAGAVYRYIAGNPGDTPVEYTVEEYTDHSRSTIMNAAGYAFGRRRWLWSDDTTFDMSYFIPASMFDDRFERVN